MLTAFPKKNNLKCTIGKFPVASILSLYCSPVQVGWTFMDPKLKGHGNIHAFLLCQETVSRRTHFSLSLSGWNSL